MVWNPVHVQRLSAVLQRLATDGGVVLRDGSALVSAETFAEHHASLLDRPAHFEWTTVTHLHGRTVGMLIVMTEGEDAYFDLVYGKPTVVAPVVQDAARPWLPPLYEPTTYGVFTTERRPSDWIAYTTGERGNWEAGRSDAEALGKLWLRLYHERLNAVERER